MLIRLEDPLVTGIIRSYEDLTFEEREKALATEVKANNKIFKTKDLFFSGENLRNIKLSTQTGYGKFTVKIEVNGIQVTYQRLL